MTSDRDSTDSPNENEFFDRLPRCVIDAAGVSRQFSSSDDDEDDSRASCCCSCLLAMASRACLARSLSAVDRGGGRNGENEVDEARARLIVVMGPAILDQTIRVRRESLFSDPGKYRYYSEAGS